MTLDVGPGTERSDGTLLTSFGYRTKDGTSTSVSNNGLEPSGSRNPLSRYRSLGPCLWVLSGGSKEVLVEDP